jgi:hypothetical protein
MLYMVVERFKGGDAVPVYRRFRERGRMAPEGLDYVSSWVDDKLARCFQVMETNEWMANWSDLIDKQSCEYAAQSVLRIGEEPSGSGAGYRTEVCRARSLAS